jgi:hypothetical protein
MELTGASHTVPMFAKNILADFTAEGMSFVPLLSTFAAILLAVSLYMSSRKQARLPPGPRRWPLVGNAFDMPREKEQLVFTKWGKTYGSRNVHLSSNDPLIFIASP